MLNFKDSNINVEKSIQNERIVYNSKWFHLFLDKGLFLFIFLVILISFFMVMSIKEPAVPTDNAWKYYLPMLIFTGFLTVSGFKTDKLKKIRGINKESNRRLILDSLKELAWDIEENSQDMAIARPSSEYLLNSGRQVTIIYDQIDILVNSTAYGFLGGVSPLHFISNRSIVKQLGRKFEQKINNNGA